MLMVYFRKLGASPKMHNKCDKILHQQEQGKLMKDLKTEEYISKLDRLRWEYLRESEQYRKDWNLCKEEALKDALEEFESDKVSACEECEKDLCEDCEYITPPTEISLIYLSGGVQTYHHKAKISENNMSNKMWLRYGIQLISSPDLPYDEVMKLNEEKWRIFYTSLYEYGISEGVFKNVDYAKSPFLKATINISKPKDMLIKEFRSFIADKKKLFNKIDKNKIISRKWMLPKNVHFDALEEALRQYRMHVHEGQSYHVIASGLASSFICKVGEIHEDDDPKSRFISIVKKNIPKAKQIIKNVEQGIFP
jgi:hypothetical protein